MVFDFYLSCTCMHFIFKKYIRDKTHLNMKLQKHFLQQTLIIWEIFKAFGCFSSIFCSSFNIHKSPLKNPLNFIVYSNTLHCKPSLFILTINTSWQVWNFHQSWLNNKNKACKQQSSNIQSCTFRRHIIYQ